MGLIEVERVQVARLPEAIYNFALDTPVRGTQLDVYDIEFSGWVIGAASKAIAMCFTPVPSRCAGRRSMSSARMWPRPFPTPHTHQSPASARRSTWSASSQCAARPDRCARRRKPSPAARVTYTRQPLVTTYTPRLQPLMLTTLGRAGTTWMMRVLAEHPSIAIHREHPYELRIARHWLHAFKVSTEPRDPSASAQADTFQNDRSWAGHSPFYPPAARRGAGRRPVVRQDLRRGLRGHGAAMDRRVLRTHRRRPGHHGPGLLWREAPARFPSLAGVEPIPRRKRSSSSAISAT